MTKYRLMNKLRCVKVEDGIEHSIETGSLCSENLSGFNKPRYSSNKSIRGDDANVQGYDLKAPLSAFQRVFNPRTDLIPSFNKKNSAPVVKRTRSICMSIPPLFTINASSFKWGYYE